MKINFLNVLNHKSTSDEIAEQIVLLEAKQAETEKEKEKLRNLSKELRQRKLCGEAVSDAQIKDADLRVEDVNLTIETINDSIAKLKERLYQALEDEKDESHVLVNKRHKALLAERKALDEEFARMHARILVFAESMLGSLAEVYMKDGRLFRHNTDTHHIFKDEYEKAKRDLKHPTYYEKQVENESLSESLRQFDADKVFEAVLEKQRNKLK
jgi:hypothetical protein